MSRLLFIVVLICVALFEAACTGGVVSNVDTPVAPSLDNVPLPEAPGAIPSGARFFIRPQEDCVPLNGHLQAHAFLADADGTTEVTDRTQWSSSDPAILTADGGTLRGIAPGHAVVTAEFGERVKTFEIEVMERHDPSGAPFNFESGVVSDSRSFRAQAFGDFNRDGNLDLVGMRTQDVDPDSTDVQYSLGVMLGDGHGKFTLMEPVLNVVRVQERFNLERLLCVDFDQDGRLDLFFTDFRSNSILAYFGRGDGTFLPQRRFDLAFRLLDTQIGDLNRDGRLDVAFTTVSGSPSRGQVRVALHNPDGRLSFPVVVADTGPFRTGVLGTTIFAPTALRIGDLNSDGNLDLLTSVAIDLTQTIVLLGSGDGVTFTEVGGSLDFPTGLVTLTDLNVDGLLDVISGDGLFLGNGGGSFSALGELLLSERLNFNPHTVVGNLNGDGLPDLAVGSLFGEEVRLFLGASSGVASLSQIVQLSSEEPLLADFDNDGRQDLVLSDEDRIFMMSGRGDGTVQSVGLPVLPDLLKAESAEKMDLNQDGRPDLVLGSLDDKQFHVILSQPDGKLAFSGTYPSEGGGGLNLGVGDFDGDEQPDLADAHASIGSSKILLFHNDGQGKFVSSEILTDIYLLDLKVGDLNRDGLSDLLYIAINDDFTSRQLTCRLALPGGGFADPVILDDATDRQILGIRDLDLDGYEDIVSAHVSETKIDFEFRYGPDFQVTTLDVPAVGENTVFFDVEFADLNQDCRPDLVLADSGRRILTIVSDGTRTFREQASLSNPQHELGAGFTSFTGGSLAAGDLNSDGIPDLALTRQGSVLVFAGRGDGTFEDAQEVAVGSFLSDVEFLDVTGDRKLDLVTQHSSPSYPLMSLPQR